MTLRDDLHRLVDTLDDAAAEAALVALRGLLAGGPARSPQWGEAYLLFDGQYPGRRAPDLHHERLDVRVLQQLAPGARSVVVAPPARHRRLLQQGQQVVEVALGHAPERDTLAG